MSGTAPTRIDVQVGDISHSQLVIGDHNVIQTPDGARITIVPTGQGPVVRLRPVPFAHVPRLRLPLLGRRAELALVAQVTSDRPLQLYGPEGVGKTALLKAAAHAPVSAPEGILFASARRRNLDEILLALYEESWESDTPFVPSPAQVGRYLADRDALVILDDCGLDRDELDILRDTAPNCRFLLGSVERTLLTLGRAQALGGLDETLGIALMERELARVLRPGERNAAVTVINRVAGHPQRLVEAAALVNDGVIDLADLARAPVEVSERLNADALSSTQRRLLGVLGLLDGAALAGRIAAGAAGIPGGERLLPALEDRGWVKSASPRYRLIRPLPEASLPDDQDLRHGLHAGLIDFAAASRVGPAEVREEAEAIDAALALATAEERWDDAATLARVSESTLARSGAWVSWRRVLESGLEATRATGDRAGQAHMLHQLGSLAAAVGDRDGALEQLDEALRLREQDGNTSGAQLTRHNLGQVIGEGGGGNGGSETSGGPRPWRPGRGFFVPGLILIVVLIAGVAALNSSGSDNATPVSAAGTLTNAVSPTSAAPPGSLRQSGSGTSSTAASPSVSNPANPSVTSTPPPALPARVGIASPIDGGTYQQGSIPPAAYSCFAATTCSGPVNTGTPFDTSSPGPHTFAVSAKNRDGKVTTSTARYTVTPADTTPPAVVINSPKDGGVYPQGSTPTADYTCTDGGSGVATCKGPVDSGQAFDTSSPGAHTFAVNGVDNAGNQRSGTVTYTVPVPPR
jgi:hypothetical protein